MAEVFIRSKHLLTGDSNATYIKSTKRRADGDSMPLPPLSPFSNRCNSADPFESPGCLDPPLSSTSLPQILVPRRIKSLCTIPITIRIPRAASLAHLPTSPKFNAPTAEDGNETDIQWKDKTGSLSSKSSKRSSSKDSSLYSHSRKHSVSSQNSSQTSHSEHCIKQYSEGHEESHRYIQHSSPSLPLSGDMPRSGLLEPVPFSTGKPLASPSYRRAGHTDKSLPSFHSPQSSPSGEPDWTLGIGETLYSSATKKLMFRVKSLEEDIMRMKRDSKRGRVTSADFPPVPPLPPLPLSPTRIEAPPVVRHTESSSVTSANFPRVPILPPLPPTPTRTEILEEGIRNKTLCYASANSPSSSRQGPRKTTSTTRLSRPKPSTSSVSFPSLPATPKSADAARSLLRLSEALKELKERGRSTSLVPSLPPLPKNPSLAEELGLSMGSDCEALEQNRLSACRSAPTSPLIQNPRFTVPSSPLRSSRQSPLRSKRGYRSSKAKGPPSSPSSPSASLHLPPVPNGIIRSKRPKPLVLPGQDLASPYHDSSVSASPNTSSTDCFTRCRCACLV
ncbi:hypothetical protein VKT23_005942 [Stygiomarasmius scandens]|uniref:Uncharacterized protein n=1 Tax=Marasmiellus scandens TaxID=2682957 RepID=A0ABR1JPQ2_9AGAR